MAEPHHHESRRKTIRFNEISDKDEDYISLLPDCLLIDIISRLPETKEAVRTGTLSKRWQHLWPYVSNIIFSDYKYDQFFSKTRTKFCQSNLHKFQIHTSHNVVFKSQVNNWIRYAVSRNVQDLDLYLTTVFVLDEFMFINSCFTHLKFHRCEFNPAHSISWSNLKSLSISRVVCLSEDFIQNILAGSPLLETFEVKYCYGFRRVDITSKSVKNFVFSGYHDDEALHIIEINAPYIASLTIASGLLLWKLALVDVSCLVKALLDYRKYRDSEISQEETLKGLILSLRHVKELKIGESCFEVLSRLEDKGFTFPSNMEHPDDRPDYDSSERVDCSDNNSTESGDQ